MKKYFFETAKTQWEKQTEPKYVSCAPARTFVYAETEEEAYAKAEARLQAEYLGTGTLLLGDLKLTGSFDEAVDWSYGYGSDRRSGPTGEIGDLVGNTVIR